MDHRLPENHKCIGLPNAMTLGPEFRGFGDEKDSPKRTKPKPVTPKYTVGTHPEPEYEHKSPPVTLKPDHRTTSARASRQFLTRRSLLKSAVVFGLGAAVAVIVTDPDEFPVPIPDLDDLLPVDEGEGGVDTPTPEPVMGSAATESPTPTPVGRVDNAAVEFAAHKEVNRVRQERGLSTLRFDSKLQQIARSHSRDMAENHGLSHTGSDGSSFSERYGRAGYECRVPVGGNRYALGAENIAQTWFRQYIQTSSGRVYYSTPEELGVGLISQWMESPGHRDNILKPHWGVQGVGIAAVRDRGRVKVYATQNFC